MNSPRSKAARVVEDAMPLYLEARRRGLMHVTLEGRKGKRVTLPGGHTATEFINCSYLGLDTHPAIIQAAQDVMEEWGVHFCCARSRFSIAPNKVLEEALGAWLGGRAITFPSVTATHLSVLPLVASGALYREQRPMRLIFDRFAHASMASLKGLLREHARVETIGHNDLEGLESQFKAAREAGEAPVFLADSVYSMGGRCPLERVLPLAEAHDARLYLDDAHGTSIFGPQGQGPVFEALHGAIPERVAFTFSLSKGFGTNGGGILLPTPQQEDVVRLFGQTYAFSASLDFSIQTAALASLKLHQDGTVAALQAQLRARVALFDALRPSSRDGFSPIQMVSMKDPARALDVCEELVRRGFFVTVALFPVVPRDNPQLRLCIAVGHSDAELQGLAAALAELVP